MELYSTRTRSRVNTAVVSASTGIAVAAGVAYLQVLATLARELIGGARNHLHPHRARGVGEAASHLTRGRRRGARFRLQFPNPRRPPPRGRKSLASWNQLGRAEQPTRPILSPDRRLPTPVHHQNYRVATGSTSWPENPISSAPPHHDGRRRRRQVAAPLVGLPSPRRPRHREVLGLFGYDASVSSARIGCSSSPPQVRPRPPLLCCPRYSKQDTE